MTSRLLNLFLKLKKFDLNLFFKFLFIVFKKDYSKYPKYVSSFESNFAKKFGAKYCLTFSSGTASFYASLRQGVLEGLTFKEKHQILKNVPLDATFHVN